MAITTTPICRELDNAVVPVASALFSVLSLFHNSNRYQARGRVESTNRSLASPPISYQVFASGHIHLHHLLSGHLGSTPALATLDFRPSE